MTRKTQAPATKSNTATTTTTPTASTTFDVFRKPKDERRTALTHEKIADDLVAFQRAGGKIEVLGTTYTLKSIPPSAVPVADAAPTTSDTARSEAGETPTE
jgi:hypothetical protein